MTQRLGRWAVIGVSLLLCPALAHATPITPITYNAVLQSGVPVTGQIATSSWYNRPVGAEYYLFQASAGDDVVVAGTRLSWGYDMAFWIYEGQFDDTSAFGHRFDAEDPGYVGFYDNEVGRAGPYGDPLAEFVAPSSGAYTVAVTNHSSGGGYGYAPLASSALSGFSTQCYDPPPYRFEIVAVVPTSTSVPEPASLLWLALGLTAVRMIGRRSPR